VVVLLICIQILAFCFLPLYTDIKGTEMFLRMTIIKMFYYNPVSYLIIYLAPDSCKLFLVLPVSDVIGRFHPFIDHEGP